MTRNPSRLAARVSRGLLLAVLVPFAAAPAPAQQDQRAGYAAMFNGTAPTGGFVPRLLGGAPPILGKTMSMTLTALEYQAGAVLLAARATAGFPLHFGSHSIGIYVHPSTLLLTLAAPMPGGQLPVAFLLPSVPSALGVDLAWQGAVLDYANRAGASNLLMSSFGVSALAGTTLFATPFAASIAAHDWLKDAAGNKQSIYCNESGATVRLRIKGTKTANVGPLEFMTGNSAAYKMVPAADGTFDFTIDVPAGLCINVFNADGTKAMDVTWTIEVVS